VDSEDTNSGDVVNIILVLVLNELVTWCGQAVGDVAGWHSLIVSRVGMIGDKGLTIMYSHEQQ
jgi:hypothetical protein